MRWIRGFKERNNTIGRKQTKQKNRRKVSGFLLSIVINHGVVVGVACSAMKSATVLLMNFSAEVPLTLA